MNKKKPPRNKRRSSTPPKTRKPKASMPDLFVEEGEVGRSTLHAIFAEIEESLPPQAGGGRPRLSTLGFEDSEPSKKRVVIATASKTKHEKGEGNKKGTSAPASGSEEPTVQIGVSRAGMHTMAVIEKELESESDSAALSAATARVLEVFTFAVLDKGLLPDATDQERIEFARTRLWHRLPPGGADRIRRVESRTVDDSSVLIRVWVEVPVVT